jgi:YD repeat-containing protein
MRRACLVTATVTFSLKRTRQCALAHVMVMAPCSTQHFLPHLQLDINNASARTRSPIGLRMQIRSLVGPFVVALASLPLANAQLSPDTATGLSPYAVYKGGDIDNVNPASGNLFLDIPLVSFPQRGKDLRLAFHIYFNDKQWYIDTNAINCAGVSSAFVCGAWAGPVFKTGEATAPNSGVYIARDQNVTFSLDTSVSTHDYCPGSAPCVQTTTVSGTYALTPDGAKHYIADEQTQSSCGGNCPTAVHFQSSYPANDASRYSPTAFPIPGRNAEVVDGNGVHYTGTQVTDSNGNFITASASGWTDTLNKGIPGVLPTSGTVGPGSSPGPTEPIPGIASTTALSHCPAGTVSAREWDVPASLQYNNGNGAAYFICYKNFNYQTAFNLDTVFGDPATPTTYYQDVVETGSSGTGNMPALLLSAVVLPDGTQYTFSYEEQYLSLAQITLPTGGSITYEWQNIPFGISSAAPVSRALRKRTINPGHGQPAQTWTYYWNYTFDPPAGPGGPKRTHYPIWSVVTDPEGNDEERQLGGTDDSGNPVEKGTVAKVVSYQGCGQHDNNTFQATCSPSGGTVLRTESYSLANVGSGGADVQTPSAPTVNLQQASVITTSFGSAVKKQVIGRVPEYGSCTLNDGSGGSSVITPCYSSNQTQTVAYYDFAQGAPGALLRTDSIRYKWQDSPGLENTLLNLVSQQTQTSPGLSTETDYTYDDFAVSTSGIGTQHNTPSGVPGNLTTVKRVSNNGANSITYTKWYDTGVPYQTQDANQSANASLGNTTYAYSYVGAFPTLVTNALGQKTTYTYDQNIGKPLTVQDANLQTTMYTYADPFGRLTDVLYPNVYPQTTTKGETTYTYNPSAPSVTVTMKINPTATEQIEEDVDGVGRLITTKTTDGSAVDQVDTNYDANGRVASVSNPHRPGTPLASDGTTGYTYDALGRMLTQAQPDGGLQRWTYSGQTVDFFDETNRHWQRVNDGLGRLITVLEPDASNTPTIVTQYQYDGVGNLHKVDQTGGGSGVGGDRVRTFSYDSLSRLVAAQNPENLSGSSQANRTCPGATVGLWTTCYGYDPNGNLINKTDNRNVTTTYAYDALNRLKSKIYTNDPNNTPPVTMVYDSIASGVNTVSRLVQEYTGPSAAPLTQRIITQYDPVGRVQQENQCVMGSCATGGHTLQYSYDLAGNLHTETNGVTSPAIALTYNYDAVNRLSSVTNNYTQDAQHPNTLFSATSYGPVGLLNASLGVNSLSSVTAVTRTLTYDSRQRILTDTENGHPNLAPTATISGSERSYFVCTSGNCRSHTDGGTLTVTVNGFAATATYAAGSTSATVAQSLTNALNELALPSSPPSPV